MGNHEAKRRPCDRRYADARRRTVTGLFLLPVLMAFGQPNRYHQLPLPVPTG